MLDPSPRRLNLPPFRRTHLDLQAAKRHLECAREAAKDSEPSKRQILRPFLPVELDQDAPEPGQDEFRERLSSGASISAT
jgi:hypothetical protein